MSGDSCLVLRRSSVACETTSSRGAVPGMQAETMEEDERSSTADIRMNDPRYSTCGGDRTKSFQRSTSQASPSKGNTASGVSLGMEVGGTQLEPAENSQGEAASEENEKVRALHEECVDDPETETPSLPLRYKSILLSRLRESMPIGRLAVINLSRRGLGPDEAVLIGEAIRGNPRLSVLKLSYNELGDSGVSTIASAIRIDGKHHEKLSVLDLGFNSVGDTGCETLALNCVAGNAILQTLYLSGNRIGEKGALAVAGAILQGAGLLKLHLTANEIGPMGMKTIAGAMAKNEAHISGSEDLDGDGSKSRPSLQELHVGSTGMESEGFFAIPGMLVSNLSLRSLSVAGNGLGDRDIVLLSQAFTQNKRVPIKELDLSFNEITCQGVECLMNAVWGSETLRALKMDNNKIRDRGAQLCAVVLTSIPLEVLDLSFNRLITTTGIKALMKNISENRSLRSLGLSGVPIDKNSSKALSYALAYNSSLRAVYLDNCSAGYASQRHILAGIVSNQRASLRVFTGFHLGPIAMTLGMPRLPDSWSNEQVLGFIRFMWQQWLLKSGGGTLPPEDQVRGPAPPASVAAASKIAFSALGRSTGELFRTEQHEKAPAEQPPVDKASVALLQRSESGTISVPVFSEPLEGDFCEWVEKRVAPGHSSGDSPSLPSTVVSPLENAERRNRNLQWLRQHFKSLSDIGRLPFNNADLWQLHQYYFSPPYAIVSEPESTDDGTATTEATPPSDFVAPPPTPALAPKTASGVSRAISFQALGDAFAASDIVSDEHTSNKRPPDDDTEDVKPAAKRAKGLKPRIAYYQRIMTKIQGLGTRPMDNTLSLLRQLKYTESIIFADRNPYSEHTMAEPNEPSHADVEMILLDLL